ncbi:unnamed protein product [Nippostrongylus brasiliensis]|uniref:Uncharacterized protein n=1 Tax=Nippostrongylus brasiliensis TaxID=27835 RepID=A0A0N4XN47_NIPBR|nr:unnamed protein product [Nippostrongylus brasiliensis]
MTDNQNGGMADVPLSDDRSECEGDDLATQNGSFSREQPAPRSRGVHFSVGDKDRNDDDRKREQTETNTTINLKSWR